MAKKKSASRFSCCFDTRIAEIFALTWIDVLFREQLIAVRSNAERRKDAVHTHAAGVGDGDQTLPTASGESYFSALHPGT